MAINTTMKTLSEELSEYKESFLKKAEKHKIEAYEKGIDDLLNTGILENAINVNDQAPDFTLQDAVGNSVHLYTQLKNSNIVLTWYRGGWCPYCNLTLRAYQNYLPQFKKRNAKLIALTPELPGKSMETTEKNELTFDILSDIKNDVARKYGLVFRVPDYINELYKEHFDITEYNGNNSQELPLAATYVIDQNGVVQYAFLSADYRERAEPSDVLAALDKLNE